MFIDKFGRKINYLRIAVTDKCNLRCHYCMPENGMNFLPNHKLLSYEEIIRIVKLCSSNGVNKIRITGGEPFLRKDIMILFRGLSEIDAIEKIAITTNGTLITPHLDELKSLGISSINLSIDSLDEKRFFEITKRDALTKVMHCMEQMLEKGFSLKLNCVVMKDSNIDDIIPMVKLAQHKKLSIRFIEEMPFNGNDKVFKSLEWNHTKILEHITNALGAPTIMKGNINDTSVNYSYPDYVGNFGIIPAYTRTICGGCNRLRLTPVGQIKTCLYDEGVFNLRDFIRNNASDDQLMFALHTAIGHKPKNGFIAESKRSKNPNISESMATIGG